MVAWALGGPLPRHGTTIHKVRACVRWSSLPMDSTSVEALVARLTQLLQERKEDGAAASAVAARIVMNLAYALTVE